MKVKPSSKFIRQSQSWLSLCYLVVALTLPSAAFSAASWEDPKGDTKTTVEKFDGPFCDVRRQEGKCFIACGSPFNGGRCFNELPDAECDELGKPANPSDPTAPGNVITTPARPATCRSRRTKNKSCEVFCESDYGICFRIYPNTPEKPNVPTEDGLCARPVF